MSHKSFSSPICTMAQMSIKYFAATLSSGNNLATAHALCTLMTGWISLKKLKSLSLEILSDQLDCSVIWILHINNFFHIVFDGNVPFALKSMIYFKRSYFLAILYVFGTNPSCLSTHWYLNYKSLEINILFGRCLEFSLHNLPKKSNLHLSK